MDYLLFQLLILGCLTNSTGHVWRKLPYDLYIVETMPLLARDFQDQVWERVFVLTVCEIQCKLGFDSSELRLSSPRFESWCGLSCFFKLFTIQTHDKSRINEVFVKHNYILLKEHKIWGKNLHGIISKFRKNCISHEFAMGFHFGQKW